MAFNKCHEPLKRVKTASFNTPEFLDSKNEFSWPFTQCLSAGSIAGAENFIQMKSDNFRYLTKQKVCSALLSNIIFFSGFFSFAAFDFEFY